MPPTLTGDTFTGPPISMVQVGEWTMDVTARRGKQLINITKPTIKFRILITLKNFVVIFGSQSQTSSEEWTAKVWSSRGLRKSKTLLYSMRLVPPTVAGDLGQVKCTIDHTLENITGVGPSFGIDFYVGDKLHRHGYFNDGVKEYGPNIYSVV